MVSTSVGTEGIGDGNFQPESFDSPAAFAGAVIEALSDPDERIIGRSGSQWAQERFGWTQFERAVRAVYGLVDDSGARPDDSVNSNDATLQWSFQFGMGRRGCRTHWPHSLGNPRLGDWRSSSPTTAPPTGHAKSRIVVEERLPSTYRVVDASRPPGSELRAQSGPTSSTVRVGSLLRPRRRSTGGLEYAPRSRLGGRRCGGWTGGERGAQRH